MPKYQYCLWAVKGGRPSNLPDLYPLSFSLTRFVYIAASYCVAIHPAYHGNVKPDPMWRSANSLIVPSRLVASSSEVFFFCAKPDTIGMEALAPDVAWALGP